MMIRNLRAGREGCLSGRDLGSGGALFTRSRRVSQSPNRYVGRLSPYRQSPDACSSILLSQRIQQQDSATWYENEKECGQAILDFCKSSGINRDEVFFTTKLKLNNGHKNVKQAIQRSLDECGLGYIDLYLIHGPIGGPQARKESWEAVCEAHAEGKLKSIGISTYGVRHMQEMVDAKVPLPVITQVRVRDSSSRLSAKRSCLFITDRSAPFHDQDRCRGFLQEA